MQSPTIAELDRPQVKPEVVCAPSETTAAGRPKLYVHKLEVDHHSRMIQFGLAGSLAGAILGTVLLPRAPHTNATFTVILPLALTYWGLAFGFFVAGVRKLIVSKRSTSEFGEAPAQLLASCNAVFDDYDSVGDALAKLAANGVSAKQISVIGMDCDGLRDATAVLHEKRLDPMILRLAAAGFVIGAVWGHLACPVLNPALPSMIMSSLMAGFCGATLGALAGGHIGGMVHVDNGPMTQAKFIEGKVDGGLVAVCVAAKNLEQANALRKLL